MGVLHLVRHGQASFLTDDYDRLSPRGEDQARRLGEHWASLGLAFDAIYTGPRVRQRRTAEITGEAVRRAGLSFPAAAPLDALDEHHGGELLAAHLPALVEASPEAGVLVRAFHDAASERDRIKAADRLLRHALERWMLGLTGDAVEPFAAFRARVDAAVTSMRGGGARTIAAFTSGGTIGAIVGGVLRVDDRAALELGLVLHNASLTQLLFRDGKVSVAELNAKPHLPHYLHTYR